MTLRRSRLNRRTPQRAISPKRKLREAVERKFKALVRDRDLLTCWGCDDGPSAMAQRGLRPEVHHRQPRSQGGRDVVENGVILCGFGNHALGCHGRVDQDRQWALDRGLYVSAGSDPGAVPLIDWRGVSWWLLPSGQRRRLSAEERGAA